MKRPEHACYGAVAGVICTVVMKPQFTFVELSGAIIVGRIAALLPDMFEPAYHPNHRALFHSLLLAGIVIYGKDRLCDLLNFTSNQRFWYNLFLIGYGTHLVLDALTPKGLPLY
jgi:membrane-bound metal-dependent hydrolase YbcI (DUF457 family)